MFNFLAKIFVYLIVISFFSVMSGCGPDPETVKMQEFENRIAQGTDRLYDYWDLSMIYYKQERYEEVVKLMDTLLAQDNWIMGYRNRGEALYLLERTEEGVKDLVHAAGRGSSDAVSFMRQHGIEWGGKEKENYNRMARNTSSYNSRTSKNFKGRDEVFNVLRDDINNSNMSWSDKQKAKVKLHDDMYKE